MPVSFNAKKWVLQHATLIAFLYPGKNIPFIVENQ